MTMPVVSVEMGFTVGASTSAYLHADDTARGKADTGTAAPDEVFTDLTSSMRSFSTRRGSTRVEGPVIRYEAGTCTVLFDNSNRALDPENLDGPYVSGGVTQVRPMLVGRFRATWAGVTYDLFRGFADSWDESEDNWGPNYSETTLRMTDGFKVLANDDRVAVAAVGAGEDSGARVTRILDSAAWPATDRVVAAGDTTLQATTLDGTPLTELYTVTDTEIGEFYIDGAGRATFRGRLDLMQDSRSAVSQATFGDAGGAELPYVRVGRDYDGETIVNKALISRVGGTQQIAEDAASQAEYLIATHNRTDLAMQTESAAMDYARFVVYQGKDPEKRFSTITVAAHASPATLFPQVLGRLIGDRITIKRRPPGGGAVITKDCFIRGVTHEATPVTWVTTWVLQSATRWQFMVADHATLGRADFNAAAF